ncbi:hypothetical protein MGG_17981 [Pyricularia oryzae 70-15]|uniref:Uncharacterized protein n=3 Tax=Pyricularia oryzae TaxID=318829 RepID=G5EH71_PYRO7|nr:uncharacterized protein MGG_17981 [Pyricularia oryzae 70-15]ELQ36197.1 hypothetical protein OOU_Y34scaffold00666g58 [Pyricularia oryzae Y34]KAI7919594.1 hypothetical protein M9X92_006339 [Pyricularia oryzae]EAQ71067.1 hypothetical protein MGCH7_ch7g474 [Pyricularia oryzae 70-15]EHA46289.1 hypothetical protein MGG_17981 [Pyricularia oryzae 70-15]KAI7926137.1 hypothetical protein M0657_003896 [Pyricularia oryzae]
MLRFSVVAAELIQVFMPEKHFDIAHLGVIERVTKPLIVPAQVWFIIIIQESRYGRLFAR